MIVSAGTLASPAILLRSGIGPADELAALGIDVVSDLPVGRGMRDHPQCMFFLDAPPAEARLAGPGFAVAARGNDLFAYPAPWDEEAGTVTVSVLLNRQPPEGSVRLRSRDPSVPPVIDCGFGGILERGDLEPTWAVLQRLVRTDAFARRGIGAGDAERSFEEMVAERIGLAFHMSSTCAIGPVLDPCLRVHGVEGLLVADASAFPENVSNNPNLTCYMVGERAASLVAAA